MKKKKNNQNYFTRSRVRHLTVLFFIGVLLSGCLRPELKPEIAASTSGGNNESQATPPTVPPAVPPAPNPAKDFTVTIKDIAAKSACAQVLWTDRGRAPAAYIKGMALTYARSLCRIRATPAKPASSILRAANSGNTNKDVLAHYESILSGIGIDTNQAGDEPLQATYVIGIGLGMRESSGKYCTGWDTAAGANRASAEAEAGLFQQSYDSMSASPELRKLYDEYLADESRCLLSTFKEAVTCSSQSLLGTGAGADYQAFLKRCPAFAAEYAMTLIRILRSHFGPLNRQTAQVVPACDVMFSEVQSLIESDPAEACTELF